MSSPSRSNRFQSFTPLRTLRTAFSPTRSQRSTSTSSISTTSPLTRASSPHSYPSSIHSIRELLAVRRKPSACEFEMDEERLLFESGLAVLEPRPRAGSGGEVHYGGIFEVLSGKA
ncbi:hypothetical protein P153DRAFT_383508 [Dothidotthia symphoricarpi CBS 119687]|uniref:Uncharacterized protein n=1 Tax=Dothidotthia symphoricarpi CBS 119687 TaxID=1392245 RepID=A0A6A6AKJ8_9PLEO|nr:uncharacterized protein P153DRAFT_383508 [Dothidotthia symphoricarpi CBS 119687]KAF2131397.1 hypothetical protein P153DRAFT_383508 [Dothidotthia symphoricarpi CBS 119687]